MLLIRCYLAPSLIEGLGVYCHDPIERADKIWRYDRMLDLAFPETRFDDVETPVRDFLERYSVPAFDRPGYRILHGDEARFLNHSQAPNLDFSDGIWGRALADIPAGTELTCNYADFRTGKISLQPPRHRVQGPGARLN
jgi:hypothetical protein